uniref:Uncharacterized protein n=1 Tax=Rangifer tarandus platyrhynchus TaxID=3082113 RepID=A0ACB0DVU7_RANTA|nr:unnamed protein product [Rangifer tarandus platyrhynchus]
MPSVLRARYQDKRGQEKGKIGDAPAKGQALCRALSSKCSALFISWQGRREMSDPGSARPAVLSPGFQKLLALLCHPALGFRNEKEMEAEGPIESVEQAPREPFCATSHPGLYRKLAGRDGGGPFGGRWVETLLREQDFGVPALGTLF